MGGTEKARLTRYGNQYPEIDLDLNYIDYTPDLKDFTSSLLHEVQHAVQNIEGYLDSGSLPNDLMTRAEYSGLPVEIEARNVQRRFEDPSQRQYLPETTVDIFPDTASDPATLWKAIDKERGIY